MRRRAARAARVDDRAHAVRSGRATRSQRVTGLLFLGAGINHFAMPRPYRQIVPPGFGDPARVVAISGVAEIAGGVGVLVPRTRRLAGLGLIALLVAVFPANLYMARNPERFRRIPHWAAVRAAAAAAADDMVVSGGPPGTRREADVTVGRKPAPTDRRAGPGAAMFE